MRGARSFALCCLATPALSLSLAPGYGRRSTSLASRRWEDEQNISPSMEREVFDSARAQMDEERVKRLLDDDDVPAGGGVPQYQIALAAAGAAAATGLALTRSGQVSLVLFAVVFAAAFQDPLDDNLAGALARVVGRKTIQIVKTSEPKVKAVARTVLSGQDEIKELRQRVRELEQEKQELQLWKEKRLLADHAMSQCSLEQLVYLSRKFGLKVGGTKSELVTRLVEAGAIRLED